MVALIPARAGSKRIPGKNTKDFCGQPLIAWTIQAAKTSGVFADVQVWTDSECVHSLCHSLKCQALPRPTSTDDEPDIAWVRNAFSMYPEMETFAILRPTSPFRTAETIKRAHCQFIGTSCDSIRAVEPCRQHPAKMWVQKGEKITPFVYVDDDRRDYEVPWHSMPTQSLPLVFVQNACLEMAHATCVTEHGTIGGLVIAPFLTEGYEGVDLNTPDDWQYAEWLVSSGKVTMPTYAHA